MKRISPTMTALAAGTALCLASGLLFAKPTLKKYNVRSRPMFNVNLGDTFYGFADITTAGLNFEYCDDAQGEEQFFEVYPQESGGVDFTFAYAKPELGGSCYVSELPAGVSLIRVMGRCPGGTVELTSFDGTTVSPLPGQTVLVGDPMVLPQGCEDVVAHQVVFELKLPEAESIDGPLQP